MAASLCGSSNRVQRALCGRRGEAAGPLTKARERMPGDAAPARGAPRSVCVTTDTSYVILCVVTQRHPPQTLSEAFQPGAVEPPRTCCARVSSTAVVRCPSSLLNSARLASTARSREELIE